MTINTDYKNLKKDGPEFWILSSTPRQSKHSHAHTVTTSHLIPFQMFQNCHFVIREEIKISPKIFLFYFTHFLLNSAFRFIYKGDILSKKNIFWIAWTLYKELGLCSAYPLNKCETTQPSTSLWQYVTTVFPKIWLPAAASHFSIPPRVAAVMKAILGMSVRWKHTKTC